MLPVGPCIMQNSFLSSQPIPNVQVSGKGCPSPSRVEGIETSGEMFSQEQELPHTARKPLQRKPRWLCVTVEAVEACCRMSTLNCRGCAFIQMLWRSPPSLFVPLVFVIELGWPVGDCVNLICAGWSLKSFIVIIQELLFSHLVHVYRNIKQNSSGKIDCISVLPS